MVLVTVACLLPKKTMIGTLGSKPWATIATSSPPSDEPRAGIRFHTVSPAVSPASHVKPSGSVPTPYSWTAVTSALPAGPLGVTIAALVPSADTDSTSAALPPIRISVSAVSHLPFTSSSVPPTVGPCSGHTPVIRGAAA